MNTLTQKLIDAGALRQYAHNDGTPGTAAGYDRETADAVLAACDGYDEAANLAKAIYSQHYRNDAREWRVLPDIRGVLSQISNMVAGMTRHGATPPAQGSIDAERAEFEAWNSTTEYSNLGSAFKENAFQAFLAAKRLARQSAAPEGWKLVPIKPTDDMCDATEVKIGGCYSCSAQIPSWGECAEIYSDMLAAAPAAPAVPVPQGPSDGEIYEAASIKNGDPALRAEVNAMLDSALKPVPQGAPAPAAELSARLREYADDPGYSHNDYADTMRQAADEIDRGHGLSKAHISGLLVHARAARDRLQVRSVASEAAMSNYLAVARFVAECEALT